MPDLDLGAEYLIFDNPKVVTITNPDGVSATTSYAIKRGSQADIVMQNSLDVAQTTVRWHVWKASLSDTAFVPARDGSITDASSNKWYINAVNYVTLESRFELDTTLQAGKGTR